MESSLFVNSLSTPEKTYHLEDNPKIYAYEAAYIHNPDIFYNIHMLMVPADGSNSTVYMQ
jgi:hypothetical protein